MKLIGRIAEKEHQIEVREQDGRLTAEIDGQSYELEVSEPEPGVYHFKSPSGRVFEASVSEVGSSETIVRVRDDEFAISVIDPKRLRGSGGNDHSHDGRAEIKTAMPGKVVRILVEPGTQVNKGDGVIVVEAMKMQNEMKSPKDGVVRAVQAKEGEAVNAGAVLVIIE
jgi:biotin carboxyl carrier protein